MYLFKVLVFVTTVVSIAAACALLFSATTGPLVSAVLGGLYGYFYAPELIRYN